jgi:hypothetical protein
MSPRATPTTTNTNMNMTTESFARTFTMQSVDPAGKFLAEELLKKGFESNLYIGVSEPTGRQRRTYTAMFYRKLTGEFVNMLAR